MNRRRAPLYSNRLSRSPEVARRLNKKVRTVDNWMQQGLLPYYKIGRSVSFKWSEVEQQLRRVCRVCRCEEVALVAGERYGESHIGDI